MMIRLAIPCVLFAACGAYPISFSSPVGINLKAKSGDVSGNAISDEKEITTESGNPYGAFINDAVAELGHDPSAVELDAVTLTLGAGSTGVIDLAEVFEGDVDVAFLINESNNTYDVAHVVDPDGIGPVGMDVVFESDAVTDVDYANFLDGKFRVVVRGDAAPDFETKGAEANLQVTLTFAAFE
jgi:hypothetical protein